MRTGCMPIESGHVKGRILSTPAGKRARETPQRIFFCDEASEAMQEHSEEARRFARGKRS